MKHVVGMSTLLAGDSRALLAEQPEKSVQTCLTSPPYWNLRDYGHNDQIGTEPSVAAYVAALVDTFRAVKRVLKDDGTLWLNLGDTSIRKRLQLIPARVALALQDDGWILRSKIVWAKTRGIPEPVRDRPTSAHEKVFLFSKRARYVYHADAIAEPASGGIARPQKRRAIEIAQAAGLTEQHFAAIRACGITDCGKAALSQTGTGRNTPEVTRLAAEAKAVLRGYYREFLFGDTRNARDVWHIDPSTEIFRGGHLAVMPISLADRCIRAGSKVGDLVLDPFGGSGTTAIAAARLSRPSLLVEVNPAYVEMAVQRLLADTNRPRSSMTS